MGIDAKLKPLPKKLKGNRVIGLEHDIFYFERVESERYYVVRRSLKEHLVSLLKKGYDVIDYVKRFNNIIRERGNHYGRDGICPYSLISIISK